MKQLVNIQNELKVPKGNFNSFGKYKYRSAEDILEAVKPILLKYNATLILSDDIIGSGDKQFIKASATLSLEGESTVSTGFAQLSEHKGMSAEQCTGTASSYARKYALNGLFLIDETESDSDNEQVKPAPEKTEVKADPIQLSIRVLMSCKSLTELADAWKTIGVDMQKNQYVMTAKEDMKLKLTPNA